VTPVRYRVLGPLELRDGDGRLVRLHAPKRRTLLGLLLLCANQPVGTDRLAEALWGPRPPASAAGVLRTYLSWLRRGLGLTGRDGMGQVVAEPGGYRLVVPAGQLDLLVFDRLAAESEQALAAGDLELAAAGLEEAAGLWRGHAFEDVGLDGRPRPSWRSSRSAASGRPSDGWRPGWPLASTSGCWSGSPPWSSRSRCGSGCGAAGCWRCTGRAARRRR
jgi:Bacterial transcriptional activator domain/Transcriptional regulatory protein, C terminal